MKDQEKQASRLHFDQSRFRKDLKPTPMLSPTPVYSRARLIVRSNVDGDTITIDGRDFGSTPQTFNLPAGTHRVTVSKKGFTTATKEISFRAFDVKTAHARLSPLRTPSPSPKNRRKVRTKTPKPTPTSALPSERRAPMLASAVPVRPEHAFTLGSTEKDVLRAMGKPTSRSTNALVYGKSQVFLKDGMVVGWVDSERFPLAISTNTLSKGGNAKKCIRVGDALADLVATAGPPRAIVDSRWYYGLCYLAVRDGLIENVHQSSECAVPMCPD